MTVVKPKQIAGRGVTRKNFLPPGMEGTDTKKQTSYGVIIQIIWKDNLLDPRIETLKIIKETDYNIDAIDCDGKMHTRLNKADLIFLGYADEMKLTCTPPRPRGTLWRVVNKEKLMAGKEQIIRITHSPDIGQHIDYIDEFGTINKRVWKTDLFFLGILEEDDPSVPEKLKLENLEPEKENDGDDLSLDDEFDDGNSYML